MDSITFVPHGQGVGCLPEGMLTAKANTRTGFKWMLKTADQLTAILVLTAGAKNKRAAEMAGNKVWYTTSFNLLPGEAQLEKPSSMTSTTVATLVVAQGRKLSRAEVSHYYNNQEEVKHLLIQALKSSPVQTAPIPEAEANASPDILGALFGDISPDWKGWPRSMREMG